MSDSEEHEPEPEPEPKGGRPPGKTDSAQRTRRTAQEISNDKIQVAQMKLDALRPRK